MIRRDEGVGDRLRALFGPEAIRDRTDGQLLERFVGGPGDEAERAFAALVERHGPMVLRVARGILADPHAAQDAFQATFLVLLRKARGLWVRDSLGPWLYQVAHRAASRLRAEANRRRRLDGRGGSAADEAAPATPPDVDLARILHEEIGRLPERYRAPVVLCDLEGRTHEQAARSLGWPVGTVKSRQARARERLRGRLARRGVEPTPVLALLRPDVAALASCLTHTSAEAAGRFIATRAFAPGPAATLARGVLRTMAITRWSKFAAVVALVGAVATGSTLNVPAQPPPVPPPAPPVAVPAPEAPAPPDRPAVVGRLVDAQGNPIPFVTVGICRQDAYLMPPFWDDLEGWTRTDPAGRFVLPATRPGKYQVLPVAGIEVVGGSTPPDQVPPEHREAAARPGKHRFARPLPGAFPATVVDVAAGGEPAEVEIRAIPHVTLTARFIDGAGRPAEAWPDGYPIDGTLDAAGPNWRGWFDLVPGRPDTMTARVPARLTDLSVRDNEDNVWWTWAPGTSRVSHAGIHLRRLDGDRPEIVVQRFRSNSLEIRLRPTAGRLPEKPRVSVFYRTPFRGEGGRIPRRVADGVYRLDEMIAPGRLCEVTVTADGFQTASTKPFQFREEGQAGVVEVVLTPGTPTRTWKVADAQAVELKTPDGRPIPPPVEERGPERTIACRAVDRATGRPVAGAVVEVDVERRIKEDADESSGTVDRSDRSEAKTDADGRFTVSIRERAIADRTPLATTQVRIMIRHPGYVSDFEGMNVAELATRPVSDDFPKFRAVALVPARRITGRVVGPDGRPMKDVQLYQATPNHVAIPAPPTPRTVFIPDLPETDEAGRFAFNAPVGAALSLEFRAVQSARRYHAVPADATDLGDIRVAPGARVAGRVVDAQGAPVPLITVTTPAVPTPEAQPNFLKTTDKEGRFRTDELPPGTYQAIVGDFHHDEQGKSTAFDTRLAPGLYVPLPFEVRADRPPPELVLRPVPHATVVARLATTRPESEPREDDGKPPTDEQVRAAIAEFKLLVPGLVVKGTYQGAPWASGSSHLQFSDDWKTYTARVPKGLADARLEFGTVVQRFQLGPDGPELFGTSYPLAEVDADLPAITLRRYRETTLEVALATPDGKPAVAPRFEARYAREPAMRAAGVAFEVPLLQAAFEGGRARLSVLPDEEVSLRVPDAPAVGVRLAEGETRRVTLIVPGDR